MANYKKMYQTLLIASERALAMLEKGDAEAAREKLAAGEFHAENIYVETCDKAEKPESGEDRLARVNASFLRLSADERAALRWVSKHRTVLDKIVVGEELTPEEMKALIGATADYGVYPLYFIHTRKTELDEAIAFAAARSRAARRAAERSGQ